MNLGLWSNPARAKAGLPAKAALASTDQISAQEFNLVNIWQIMRKGFKINCLQKIHPNAVIPSQTESNHIAESPSKPIGVDCQKITY